MDEESALDWILRRNAEIPADLVEAASRRPMAAGVVLRPRPVKLSMSSANDPGPGVIAERIDAFVSCVDEYLSWDFIENVTAQQGLENSRRDFRETETQKRMLYANDKRMEARAKLLRLGQGLAPLIESVGRDCSVVLELVHAADRGGGPLAVRNVWSTAKVKLQRIAVQLRTGGGQLKSTTEAPPHLKLAPTIATAESMKHNGAGNAARVLRPILKQLRIVSDARRNDLERKIAGYVRGIAAAAAWLRGEKPPSEDTEVARWLDDGGYAENAEPFEAEYSLIDLVQEIELAALKLGSHEFAHHADYLRNQLNGALADVDDKGRVLPEVELRLVESLLAWCDEKCAERRDGESQMLPAPAAEEQPVFPQPTPVYAMHDKPAAAPVVGADGPFGTDGFRWCGSDNHGLTPKPFRLVDALWKAPNRTLEFSDLAEPVFRDHAVSVTESTVGSLRREANNFFKTRELPFRVAISGDRVTLKEKK